MSEFIRLQLKLKWGVNRNNDKKSAIMTAAATLLAVAIALALIWALTTVLKTAISVSAKQLAQLYLTVVMIGLTVVATGMQMHRLYRPGDLNITARFPLSPFKLFASYLILNYIDLTIYSAILLFPILTVFGVAMKCFTFVYFLGMTLGVIFMPMIPFALSVFIAIPLVYAAAALERHGIVRLVIFIAFLAGCFVLYDYILTVLAQFFIHRNWETGTLEIWRGIMSGLDSFYNPAYYLGNMIFFDRFWLGIGAILAATVVLTAGGVALASVVCGKLRVKALENGFGGNKKLTQIDDFGSARAILRYNFKEILRTRTYSYFYLGVAISTPVMVFFCDRLASVVGEATVGGNIGFGASMLVVSVFMAMICSFTGTVLSVEGKNFYITKLVPVSYRKQLLVKGFLNICVAMVALAISVIVMGSLKFISGEQIAVLVFTAVLFATGLVFNGINLNLVNPNLKPKANGETEEINITYMLLIGLVIAAGIGACSILVPRTLERGALWAYLICLGAALVYALVNFLIFWFTADEKYKKIEA